MAVGCSHRLAHQRRSKRTPALSPARDQTSVSDARTCEANQKTSALTSAPGATCAVARITIASSSVTLPGNEYASRCRTACGQARSESELRLTPRSTCGQLLPPSQPSMADEIGLASGLVDVTVQHVDSSWQIARVTGESGAHQATALVAWKLRRERRAHAGSTADNPPHPRVAAATVRPDDQ